MNRNQSLGNDTRNSGEKNYETPGDGFSHAVHPFSMPRHRAIREQVRKEAESLVNHVPSRQETKFFLREADFITEYQKYISKYPKLKDVFTLLELSFGTQRNDFHRMEDLTIGFLHTVTQSLSTVQKQNISRAERNLREPAYKRWHELIRYTGNAGLLHSGIIPQDFYEEVTEIARQILNEYPDIPGQEPRDPIFFGGAYGHPLGYDVLMKIGKISLPIRHIGYIAEKIINELVAEKAWGDLSKSKERFKTELGRVKEIDTREIIRDSISLSLMLFEKNILSGLLEKNLHDCIDVDMQVFRSGIEEFVDLRLDLIRENYRAVLDRLGSRNEKQIVEMIDERTKKKKRIKQSVQIIGRLDDSDYILFSGHYHLLGLQFFTTNEIPQQTWSNKYKDYLCLMNLFHLKKGLKKSELLSDSGIKNSINNPSVETIQEINEVKKRYGYLLGIPQN